MRIIMHVILSFLLLLFDEFIIVYVFVYTQTLADVGDLLQQFRGIYLCYGLVVVVV